MGEELNTFRKDVLITELGLLSERCSNMVQELTDIRIKLDNIATIIRIIEEAAKDPEFKGW